MRILGNCLVKNEDDMIVETLSHAVEWCDRIFVFDNGSTDATWDKVREFAAQEPRVVPFKSDPAPFRNSLRMDVFQRYKQEADDGDWWCVLDADELYVDDPKEFLSRVPRRHHVVWGAYFQHYFTDEDVRQWEANPTSYPPHQSAQAALKYFRCDWSEVRFYRHRRRLLWTSGSAPRHLGIVHPRRIRFRHYQYRSPEQIQKRLETRQLAMQQGCENFSDYCSNESWREKVVPAASCQFASSLSDYQIDESKLPRHLETWRIRTVKHVMHGLGFWA